jgi:hypothetical protein
MLFGTAVTANYGRARSNANNTLCWVFFHIYLFLFVWRFWCRIPAVYENQNFGLWSYWAWKKLTIGLHYTRVNHGAAEEVTYITHVSIMGQLRGKDQKFTFPIGQCCHLLTCQLGWIGVVVVAAIFRSSYWALKWTKFRQNRKLWSHAKWVVNFLTGWNMTMHISTWISMF